LFLLVKVLVSRDAEVHPERSAFRAVDVISAIDAKRAPLREYAARRG
jgi:hypothetical protein